MTVAKLTPDIVQAAIKNAREAGIRAVQADDFSQGMTLADDAQKLADWLDQGMQGDPPVDISAYASLQSPANASPQSSAALNGAEALLSAAEKKAEEGDFTTALAFADIASRQVGTPEWQAHVTEVTNKINATYQERLGQLLQSARQAESDSSTDLATVRQHWERVLQFQIDNIEASTALVRIGQQERVEHQREQIRQLHAPLESIRKDLRAIERARSRAYKLKLSDEMRSLPELTKQLDDIIHQLDDLRNQIFMASIDASSAERAGNYDVAIQKYDAALKAGYDTILDDTTGEVIEVSRALQRVTVKQATDLRTRANVYVRDAQQKQSEGNAETAVTYLEQARALLVRVGEGGIDDTRAVDTQLMKARDQLKSKQDAQNLVNEAEAQTDPEQARIKLLQARQRYSVYPGIEQLIRAKEELILAQVVADMDKDLANARSILAQAWQQEQDQGLFEQARTQCRMALSHGGNLTVSSADRDSRSQEARNLQDEITKEEAAFHILLGQLRAIDGAIDRKDGRLAANLIVSLGDALQNDWRVKLRQDRLDLLRTDEEKLAEAERLFFQDQNLEATLELSKTLFESPSVSTDARQLSFRAQTRITLKQARELHEAGKLDEALQAYKQVIGYESELPPTDHVHVLSAQTEAQSVEQDIARIQDLHDQITSTKAIRVQGAPDWSTWLQAITTLRRSAPAWLIQDVETEYKAGVEDWNARAMQNATRYEGEGNYQHAYETLKALVNVSLLPNNDPTWQRIQYEHFTSLAQSAMAGTQPSDWEKAEEYAQLASNTAPTSLSRQARDAQLSIVRDVTLRQAALASASSQGAQLAIKVLQDKMERYKVLKIDPLLCERSIRYFLDEGRNSQAVDMARSISKIPGEEQNAERWALLSKAVEEFVNGDYSAVVETLVNLRHRTDANESFPAIQELSDYMTHRVLTQLLNAVASTTASSSKEEMVTQLQNLERVHLLDQTNPAYDENRRKIFDWLGIVPVSFS
jgi:hypothetical protein